MSLAIETRRLRKEYGPKVAVQSLSLTVERGEIFGFLGPNGAGKTTSIKMLLGLVRPTAGAGKLLGIPIENPECRRRVGFLPEDFRFHEWLRGDELLDLHGKLHHMPRQERARRVPELLELVGLRDAARQPLRTYSKGMLQRIGLAQALVNSPEVVFLDEPTSGLDPLGRRMVRDILYHLGEQGTTVFLNSHLLSEVEVTCTRVAFVAEGSIRLVVNPKTYRNGLLQVDVRVGQLDDWLVPGLQRWSQQVDVNREAKTLILRLADDRALPEIARWIVGRGTDLYQFAPRPLSLEDLFMEVVGDKG